MNKPFSIAYEEFKQEISKLINNCGLPPFAIESLLQIYLREINVIVKDQYINDKLQYEKFLNENNQKIETKQE